MNNDNRIEREVPLPTKPESYVDQFESLYKVIQILRTDCPWDREQTHQSIAHLLIEESYEALEEIEKENYNELAKELGDLLLHVLMHCVIAEERGSFNFIDVAVKLRDKLVNRHPHVFGEIVVNSKEKVVQNWEALKMKEGRKSILDGVPKSMPALIRAQRIQHKVANVGFDWDNKKDVWNKVKEEFGELYHELEQGDEKRKKSELGDFIFSLVNAARFEGIVAEEALQLTNDKFKNRFQYIEQKAKEKGVDLHGMTLTEMDALWEEAKLHE